MPALNIGAPAGAGIISTSPNGVSAYSKVTINQTLPLDGLSPVFAVSMRKLLSTYSGSCVTLYRPDTLASSNINFSSTIDGAKNLWVDQNAMTAFSPSSNAYYSCWFDQSGFGNHAIQATQSIRPVALNAGNIQLIRNKPCVNYTTYGQSLATANRVLQTCGDFTLILVFSPAASNCTPISCNGNDANQRMTMHAPEGGNLEIDINGQGANRLASAWPTIYGAPYIITATNYLSGRENRINGQIVASTSTPATYQSLSQGSIQIGSTLYGGSYMMFGQILEMIIFSGPNLSDSQLLAIERNIGAAYGITTI